MLLYVGLEAVVAQAPRHLVVLFAQVVELGAQLADVLLAGIDVLDQVALHAVDLLHLRVGVQVASTAVLGHLFLIQTVLHLLELLQLLSATLVLEALFGLCNLLSELLNVTNQFHVVIHDLQVVFLVQKEEEKLTYDYALQKTNLEHTNKITEEKEKHRNYAEAARFTEIVELLVAAGATR